MPSPDSATLASPLKASNEQPLVVELLRLLLSTPEGRLFLRQVILETVSVSKETGALLFDVTPREFYEWAKRGERLVKAKLSGPTHRYTLASVIDKLDEFLEGKKRDRDRAEVMSRIEDHLRQLFGAIEQQPIQFPTQAQRHLKGAAA